ncbi:MAG: hypothetical protein ABSF09_13160 [Candidatus Bathyarchaeia archaeon]|jgi:hypothetical protein
MQKKIAGLGKLISEEKVPRLASRSAEWLKRFRRIPKGTALVLRRDELEITPSGLYMMLNRFKKAGLLPSNYYVKSHSVDGTKTIYIVHSAAAKPVRQTS